MMMLRALSWFIGLIFAGGGLYADEVQAMLLVIGDQHSAYARTAQIVARVDQLKRENPGVPLAVLIDGDTFELGNVVAKRSAGTIEFAMLRALSQRAPTVLNLGNHEPEFYDVAETVAHAKASGATVIGNIVDRTTEKLFAPSSICLKFGAHEAVIVGLTTDLISQYRAAVRPTLDLTNPVVWAKQKLPELLSAAPLHIVLSHAGLKYDREILALVPDGTLFAGAHDHVRFVHRTGRTVYFHSGSWNGHLSIVRLRFEDGRPSWQIEQVPINETDAADPELAAFISSTREKNLTPADRATIGHLNAVMAREEAARFAVRVVKNAAGADAAFIGNTTFGDGLPAGNVSRESLDACVRFDGTIWVAEVNGARLREILLAANQGPETPLALRRDEPLVGDGPRPSDVIPEKIYRIATTDWGVKNRGRYFGSDAIEFGERPELRLKTVVTQALNE